MAGYGSRRRKIHFLLRDKEIGSGEAAFSTTHPHNKSLKRAFQGV
jgi:hypothetical protein